MLVTQLSIKSLSFSSTGTFSQRLLAMTVHWYKFHFRHSSALRLYSVVLKSAKSALKISEIIFSPGYCCYQQSLLKISWSVVTWPAKIKTSILQKIPKSSELFVLLQRLHTILTLYHSGIIKDCQWNPWKYKNFSRLLYLINLNKVL